MVVIDIESRQLNVELSKAEIHTRLAAWQPPTPHHTSASEGAVTQPGNL